MFTPVKDASSFDGHRSTAEFFYILDHFVKVDANDYRLQPIENYLRLARPPVERTSGNIAAGDYLIGKLPRVINLLILTSLQSL
jgi:hypothetical protein